jgi:nucleotide-binding universal stress UspA family protein
MFRRVLVPVDLTDRHGPVLDLAARLASDPGAEVVVLHVIELVHGLSREDDPAFYRRLEAKAKESVDRLVGALAQKKARARAEILYGNRVLKVTEFAHQWPADLIVLASRPFDPARPGVALASLSHQVGLLAPCPALLVK